MSKKTGENSGRGIGLGGRGGWRGKGWGVDRHLAHTDKRGGGVAEWLRHWDIGIETLWDGSGARQSIAEDPVVTELRLVPVCRN